MLIFTVAYIIYSLRDQSYDDIWCSKTIILAGALSGGLHAISGPDHFAAIIPIVIGLKWTQGFKFGAVWSFGHGLATAGIGIIGFIAKDRIGLTSFQLHFNHLYLDLALGLSLIAIGVMGLKEGINDLTSSEESAVDDSECGKENEPDKSQPHLYLFSCMLHGFILGLAWDSVPSLLPVMVAKSDFAVVAFLLSYGIGTVLAMSVTTAILCYIFKLFGNAYESALVLKLSIFASFVAMWLGLYYMVYSTMNHTVLYFTSESPSVTYDDTATSGRVQIDPSFSDQFEHSHGRHSYSQRGALCVRVVSTLISTIIAFTILRKYFTFYFLDICKKTCDVDDLSKRSNVLPTPCYRVMHAIRQLLRSICQMFLQKICSTTSFKSDVYNV